MCIWLPDADGIEMDSDALNVLYVNNRIRNFLSKKSKSFGISSIKGQGKTFLIKIKRKKIQEGYGTNKDYSISCYPVNRMVSVLDRSLTIKESLYNYLDDFSIWINIWKIALVITLMQDPESNLYYKDINLDCLKKSRDIVKDVLTMENRTLSITNVFSKLLTLDKNDLNKLVRSTNEFILFLDRITHGVCFFVDKIDQAFSLDMYPPFGSSKMSTGPRNASFWQYAQFSLAIMSYDVHNMNNHIKVYFTIRKEALIDAEKLDMNSFRNVESYIMDLSYSKSELREMFGMYINAEDKSLLKDPSCVNVNEVKAFVGFNKIKHQYINKSEDVFDYIYRHSMKRPCDIMRICREISNNLNCINEHEIRKIVNNTARADLNKYISEQSPFLPCKFDELKEVLIGINTNVFNLNYMKNACDRYNLFKGNIHRCTRNCLLCQSLQPFSILYNIGLLGYLKDGTREMFFSKQGSSIISLNTHSLTNHKLFFLHPCLTDLIIVERRIRNLNFYQNNSLIITDGEILSKEEIKKANSCFKSCERKMSSERIFVSSTVNDLINERNIVRERIFQLNKTPIMSEHEDFRYITDLTLHSHDVCIKEASKCKNLIFIIGKKYGGNYAGNNYAKIKAKIQEDSQSKLLSPSISLMELYEFKNDKNRHFHIFVSEEIMNSLYREDLIIKNGIDKEIVAEVKFLNHMIQKSHKVQGNWFHVYKDLEDFKSRVNNLIFL